MTYNVCPRIHYASFPMALPNYFKQIVPISLWHLTELRWFVEAIDFKTIWKNTLY